MTWRRKYRMLSGMPAASNTDFSQQPVNGPNEIAALHSIGYNFAVAAVPEPGSVALLVGMATIGVSVLRRKRRK